MCILASCLRPIRINLVIKELAITRLTSDSDSYLEKNIYFTALYMQIMHESKLSTVTRAVKAFIFQCIDAVR